MIDLNFFSNISRDVAMATNFVSYQTCSLGAEVSQDPLDWFSQSLHRMVSEYLYIVYNFGDIRSRNLGVTLLTIAPFVAIRQKLAYYAKYLRMPWTYLDLLWRFGRRISGDDFPNIRLAFAQGTLLWQPVKHGRCSQTLHGTNLLFAPAFDKGLADHKSTFTRFNVQ